MMMAKVLNKPDGSSCLFGRVEPPLFLDASDDDFIPSQDVSTDGDRPILDRLVIFVNRIYSSSPPISARSLPSLLPFSPGVSMGIMASNCLMIAW